jgi:hypothetical protein
MASATPGYEVSSLPKAETVSWAMSSTDVRATTTWPGGGA